ncbi:hypothetical protein APS67_005250 [Streptomyces sp. AVP053U2]|nr:hypothetical protein APS67_005250 [Streptomyces sp. AVP053U2]
MGAAVPLQLRADVLGAGVDEDVGAQLPGEFELVVGDVDGGDGGAGDLRVLHRQVAQSADAGDGDELGGPDTGDLQGLVGGDARAGQRGGVDGADALGHGLGEIGPGQHLLGVPTVTAVAGVDLTLAQRLPAGQAVLAPSARAAEPRHGDPLTDGEVGDALAELLDEADAFVAGYEGRGGLDGPVAVRGVDVGVAQPGRLDADADLPGAGLGVGTLLDDQGLTEFPYDRCLHDVLASLSG